MRYCFNTGESSRRPLLNPRRKRWRLKPARDGAVFFPSRRGLPETDDLIRPQFSSPPLHPAERSRCLQRRSSCVLCYSLVPLTLCEGDTLSFCPPPQQQLFFFVFFFPQWNRLRLTATASQKRQTAAAIFLEKKKKQ